jgi:hypothetical protein
MVVSDFKPTAFMSTGALVNQVVSDGYLRRYIFVLNIFITEDKYNISNVRSWSPAYNSGLKNGDIISMVNGNTIKGQADFKELMRVFKVELVNSFVSVY